MNNLITSVKGSRWSSWRWHRSSDPAEETDQADAPIGGWHQVITTKLQEILQRSTQHRLHRDHRQGVWIQACAGLQAHRRVSLSEADRSCQTGWQWRWQWERSSCHSQRSGLRLPSRDKALRALPRHETNATSVPHFSQCRLGPKSWSRFLPHVVPTRYGNSILKYAYDLLFSWLEIQ